jgi:hypothetical protein
MTEILPDYIEARIRQRPPYTAPVLRGSTPVVAFGDLRKSEIATLGWNPSRAEFLDSRGNELVGDERRLETLTSIGETDLAGASADAVCRVFNACNNYFHRRPYRWFNKLEKLPNQQGASYYDGSACHLDLVQWATDPVWGKLSRSDQTNLIEADIRFLRNQLSQEKIRLLLLNGSGIAVAYQKRLDGTLRESRFPGGTRLKLFAGCDPCGLKVVGWNINLQTSFGVSNDEIKEIGAAVKTVARRT